MHSLLVVFHTRPAVPTDRRRNDSGSASSNVYLYLSNGAGADKAVNLTLLPNDYMWYGDLTVNCDANGEVWYQTFTSGTNTMDAWLAVHGYYI
jgi:hypothetical protein